MNKFALHVDMVKHYLSIINGRLLPEFEKDMRKIHVHHVHASQRYKSYLTLVINKERLLIDLLRSF
jgi:hypothetical protein